MSYPNAVLTLRHRLNVTQLVVEEDLLIGDVTARFQVVCLSLQLHHLRGLPRQEAGGADLFVPCVTSGSRVGFRGSEALCLGVSVAVSEEPRYAAAGLGRIWNRPSEISQVSTVDAMSTAAPLAKDAL